MIMTTKQMDLAIQFWADALRAPPRRNNGDDSPHGPASQALAIQVAVMAPDPTREQLETFAKVLRALIEVYANEVAPQQRMFIGCDYDPDGYLRTAASEAGISFKRFPWKTHMVIDGDSVQVSCGYGAPYKELMQDDGGITS